MLSPVLTTSSSPGWEKQQGWGCVSVGDSSFAATGVNDLLLSRVGETSKMGVCLSRWFELRCHRCQRPPPLPSGRNNKDGGVFSVGGGSLLHRCQRPPPLPCPLRTGGNSARRVGVPQPVGGLQTHLDVHSLLLQGNVSCQSSFRGMSHIKKGRRLSRRWFLSKDVGFGLFECQCLKSNMGGLSTADNGQFCSKLSGLISQFLQCLMSQQGGRFNHVVYNLSL